MVSILCFSLLFAALGAVLAMPVERQCTSTSGETYPCSHPGESSTARSRIFPTGHHTALDEAFAPRITVDPVDITIRYAPEILPLEPQSWSSSDTNIALINATPYRWARIDIHHYQMDHWLQWPEYIYPGQAITHQAWTYRGPGEPADTAGEVTYNIEGTDSPMSLEVKYKALRHHKFGVQIHFKDNLETDTTWKYGRVGLADAKMPGGSSFLLAGHEGSLTSSATWDDNDANKVGWMQSLFPELGRLPLREIIMPRSHHAALEDNNYDLKNVARKGNTVTQIHNVSRQLRMEGVRVLDTRVMMYEGNFYEAHGTMRNKQWYGALGEKLENVIEQINVFNDQHSGELIIWDFHKETWSNRERRFRACTAAERSEFYQLLKKVKHRAVLPEGKDITPLPLSSFIGDKNSSVILRFHKSWQEATPKTFPGGREGFVHSGNFPVRSLWSEEYDLDKMTKDQLQKLGKHRPHRHAQLFDLQWLRTLTGDKSFFVPHRLITLGRSAMVTLREDLWNRLTDQTYPNWITVDTVDGSEMRGLVKAMNRCFVLRKCGDWVKKPRS